MHHLFFTIYELKSLYNHLHDEIRFDVEYQFRYATNYGKGFPSGAQELHEMMVMKWPGIQLLYSIAYHESDEFGGSRYTSLRVTFQSDADLTYFLISHNLDISPTTSQQGFENPIV